jgi:hypothetical protein
MPDVTRLRALIEWAEQHGAPERLCAAASREFLDLIDRPEADRRRVATLERGRRIERLRRDGLPRALILERLSISRHQYKRARRVVRESRTLVDAGSSALPTREDT